MWSSDRRSFLALAGLAALGACGFTPVYGPGGGGAALGGIQPQIVAEPAHEISAGFVELSHVSLPNRKVLPMPVEGDPTHCVQSPEDG